jgi:DnaJ-class molecular chaperone
MVAGNERMTIRNSVVDCRSDEVSLRQAFNLNAHKSDSAEAPCAYCHGKGTHPLGILSWLPTCCACGGSGITRAQLSQENSVPYRDSRSVKRQACAIYE